MNMLVEVAPSPNRQFQFCEGPDDAEIAIIMQSPSRRDVELGKLLMGPTGGLFRSLCREAGLDLRKCVVTSISKTRPADDLWSNIQAPMSVLRENLIEELAQFPRLKLIVPVGEPAFSMISGKKGKGNSIGEWRGSVFGIPEFILKKPNLRCIPTQNPAAKFHQGENEYKKHASGKESKRGKVFTQVIVADLKRVVEEIREWKPLPEEEYKFVYPESVEEVVAWLRTHEGKLAAVDTETYQQPLRMSCMSIAISARECLSIQFEIGEGESRWTAQEEAQILLAVDRYLKKSPLIIQNSLYDLVVFWWMGIRVPPENLWLDTMLAHHCLYSDLPHGLGFLCSIYTRMHYYKSEGKTWHPNFDIQALLRYNCLDSSVTYECAMELENELQESGLKEFYLRQYQAKIPALLEASLRGIPLNLETKRIVVKQHSRMLEKIQNEMNELVGWKINVNSPIHMKKLLYSQLALPVVHNRMGNPTSDEKTIRKLAYVHKKPELKKILEIRKLRKIMSTYVNIPANSDGRVRCQFNMMGTSSGRLSESQSATGSGSTLHNMPRAGLVLDLYGKSVQLKSIKSMLVVNEPDIFIVPDYKSAESWIVAFMAEEKVLMELLMSGKDLHREVASMIYREPVEKITKQKRYLAKRVGHASNYGMGPFRFSELLTLEDIFLESRISKALLEGYHALFPKIRANYHRGIEAQLRKNRTLTTPLGRKKLFFDDLDEQCFKSAYSFVPQATVSDMLNNAIERINPVIPVLGQQHDSLWAVSNKQRILEDIEFIRKAMDEPVVVNGKEIHIPIEFNYGPSLGDLKEYKENGVVDFDWIEAKRIRNGNSAQAQEGSGDGNGK